MRDGTREIAFRFAQGVSRHDPLYVVLYSSAARGTDTDTSDLGFLVVFDTEEVEGDALRDIGRSASALEAQHNRPVEVVFANRDHRGLDPYYVEKVFGEGVLLYARQPDVTLNGAPVRPRATLSFSLEKATEAGEPAPLQRTQLPTAEAGRGQLRGRSGRADLRRQSTDCLRGTRQRPELPRGSGVVEWWSGAGLPQHSSRPVAARTPLLQYSIRQNLRRKTRC